MIKSFKTWALIALFSSSLALVSCSTDEATPDAPVVTAPTTIPNIMVAGTADITFTVNVPGGYKSASVAQSSGTAMISSEPAAGALNGSVVVSYTAGSVSGAATVTLTVTDNNSKTTAQTAAITVEEDPLIITVSENITSSRTWSTGKTYILTKRIAVVAGVELTIEEGVVVKGEFGSGANASALLIARGAKLFANGTASSPIIFTSVADEIQPGEIASPNLDPTLQGLWGGLIVLGNAPISADAEAVQIEGIPASDNNGLYGGTNAADNSGEISYISIRHGGANIGEGNEINGLTLGGVGSGTVVEYVEVISNQDDGVEFFGGTVNVSNVLVWNSGDDGIDTDQAWAGTLTNFIVICGLTTDHALEIDGPEGSLVAAHSLVNGTAKGEVNSELGDFRSGARGSFSNIYFFNFPDPATLGTDGVTALGRGDLSLSNSTGTTDTQDNFASGALSFSALQVTLPATVTDIAKIFKSGTSAHATAVAAEANTVGAEAAAFVGWSFADNADQLVGL